MKPPKNSRLTIQQQGVPAFLSVERVAQFHLRAERQLDRPGEL